MRSRLRRSLLAAPLWLALAAPGALAAEPLPGAQPLPAPLATRLAEALAAKGPDYVPRTRNLRPDGSPRFSNRLQHAHNPVDWYPWGDEAFEAAKEARASRCLLSASATRPATGAT